MSATYSLRELLVRLAIPLPERWPAGIEEAKGEMPWFMRMFLGGAAWMATCLFVVGSIFTFQDESFNGLGVGLLTLAVCINRLMPRTVFLGQLALACSMAARGAIFLSIINIMDSWVGEHMISAIALVLLAIEVVFFLLYEDATHRFLSTLLCIGLISTIILQQNPDRAAPQYMLGCVVACAMALISQRRESTATLRLGPVLTPVRYGLAIGLLGMLGMPLAIGIAGGAWVAAAGLGLALAVVAVCIVRDVAAERPWLGVAAAAACAALAAAALHMPGILGATLVLLLGFWRSDRPLLVIGGAGLLLYLGSYYYTLEWTLLVKSIALMATGSVVLLGRWGIALVARGGGQ